MWQSASVASQPTNCVSPSASTTQSPVDAGSVAGALLLLLHLYVEGGLIDRHALLAADELREVERKSVGVEQRKGLGSVDDRCALGTGLRDDVLQESDTRGQSAEERLFLLLHHLANELLLRAQLGIGIAHLGHQRRQQAVDECFLLAQERIGVTHGAAQDAADDVARLGVRRQLAVGDGKGDGTQVVGHNAHGHVLLVVVAIGEARQLSYLADDGLEHVGVVVGALALHHHAQALKAHARVDDLVRQRLQRAIGLAVILHENEVPYLDDLRIVLVDELSSGHLLLFLVGTQVNMDFRARTARTRVAHLPEIVVLVAVNDMVGGEIFAPVAGRLVVAAEPFFGRAFEHRYIEVLRVDVERFHQILVGPRDGLPLEIVAEAPIAEHLKHGVVISVVAHLFQVVVLSAHAQTLLRIGLPATLGLGIAQNDVLKLVHAGVGEHQRRVVLDDHRRRRHNQVAMRLEKLLERVAYFVGCHHNQSILFKIRAKL